MPYFYSEAPLIRGETLTVSGPEAAHLLKSRRLRNGERFAMQDAGGVRCLVELVLVKGRAAAVLVLDALPVPPPPPVRLHLLQAAVKDKAADMIVQKGTELGAAAISFFPAANSSISQKQLAAPKTLARWEKIAAEACKQCDRQFPPALAALPAYPAALASEEAAQVSWLLHPTASAAPPEIPRGHKPAAGAPIAARVLVGPEGGYTDAEAEAAQQAGFTPVRLGGQVLRAETAALAACALLLLGGP